MNTTRVRIALLTVFLCSVLPLSAQQLHSATPVDALLHQLGIVRHPGAAMPGMDMAEMSSTSASQTVAAAEPAPVVTDRVVSAAASTKVFNITEKSFAFTISPSPFVVNEGDDVTLNITVPSNDTTHGFFLENYMNSSLTMAPGRTVTVHFIANVAGTFTYLCTIVCGSGHVLMNGTFVVQAAPRANPPSIASIAPSRGAIAGGTSVTISGSDFQSGATVSFGAIAASSVDVQSASTIVAVTPAHSSGSVVVTVTNPDSQSATFNSFQFAAPPSITSITPQHGASAGGTPITITGSAFASDASVTIGGIVATNVNVVNATTITATTPPAAAGAASPGAADVTVTNGDGQSATASRAFTYDAPPVALEVSIVQPDGSPVSGGQTVTIIGSGFAAGAPITVTFGGVPATNVKVLSADSISVTAPAHAAGTVDVTVTVGTSSFVATKAFVYGSTPPRRRSVRH